MTDRASRRRRIPWGTLVTLLLLAVYPSFNVFLEPTLSDLSLLRKFESFSHNFRVRPLPGLPVCPNIVFSGDRVAGNMSAEGRIHGSSLSLAALSPASRDCSLLSLSGTLG